MSYFPNQEAVIYFAHKVLPLIRQSAPDARFLVVGRNPNRKVQALAGIEGVEVTGFVPDVRTHLARMTVSVAPFSIAAGIQNKIIEAMSYQLPVVATSRTVQGLTPAVARAVEVADAPGEMAASIVRLLQDPQFAAEKGAEGRRRVTADYNWERSLERLLELVESPVNAGIGRAAATPLQ
jgi:glycosyltransferase involved in cell wall biosynthesis